MRKFSMQRIFLILAVISIVIAIIGCIADPAGLIKKTVDNQRKDANLTFKSVDIPDFKIVYAEGGAGDTIIMLHGFTANKTFWLSFAKYFTPNYRVVIPDLPGFGESSKPQNLKYDIKLYLEKINLFAKELKLTKFHLIGNSMGGNIAGLYAVDYPEMVKTLALIDSGGVVCPTKSELELIMEKGLNPFLVKDVNDFDKLMKLTYLHPPYMPGSIKEYIIKQMIDAGPMNKKIGMDSWPELFILERKLDKISVPTLIVWGDSDKMIHVSCAQVFEEKIKNAKSVIIKECGHVPMREKTEETAAVYQDFLKGKN